MRGGAAIMKRVNFIMGLVYFCSMLTPFACAGQSVGGNQRDPRLFLFEYNGQAYYTDNLIELLSEDMLNTCIEDATNGDISKLYKILLDNCNQELARCGLGLDYRFGSWVMNWVGGKSGLDWCLTTVDYCNNLPKVEEKKPSYIYIVPDVRSCVESLAVAPLGTGKDSCPPPGKFYVSREEYLTNLSDMASKYSYTTVAFNAQTKKNPLIGLFNGYVLVLCDGSSPAYIVQPSFSGREVCQGGDYQLLPNIGSLPGGVYLAQHSEIQDASNLKADFGKYRIPLMPSVTTDTHGRFGFYLHGSSVEEKRGSGGCISMGTHIAEFIDNYYRKTNRDMVIFVDMVGQVIQKWNKNM